MATETNTVSLADFGPTRLWFTSIGSPTGVDIDLRADPGPIENFGLDWDLDELTGTIDDAGDWRWDGRGEPRDFRQNTVLSIVASIDNDSPIDYGD